ncbi:MAG: hypothetical protein ACLGHN_11940 [Bacteriovoracia bacterium]
MDFVLNLDLLNGCVHLCDGCFINKSKKVNNWKEVLENAYSIASQLTAKGLRFRELILGPTDIFSATNTVEILKDETFQSLLRLHEKTRITASCVFDNLNKERFEEIFSVLDNKEYFKEQMILEFLVPLHTSKMLNQEPAYMENNKWALDFFKTKSPKIIDWSYVININNNELLQENYHRVVKIIKEEFNTILEFNPGFFRSNNRTLIDNKLGYWKQFLQNIMVGNDYSKICLTNLDKFHNTANTICLNLIEGNVYFSPFIYEQIVDTSEQFRLQSLNADYIMNRHVELQTEGYCYANKTSQCADCSFLTACVGRNVLNFMESKQKTECMFPEFFKQIG